MRQFAISLSLGALAAAAPVSSLADGPRGIWQSEVSEDGRYLHVEIKDCGAALCGTIVDAKSPNRDRVLGKDMIKDMAPDGADAWSGGTIWAPDDDETYRAKMELLGPDRLKVSGCVALGLICRGQTWTRVK